MSNQQPPYRDLIDYIHAAAVATGLPESNIKKLLLEQLEQEITPIEYATPTDRAIELGKSSSFEELSIFVCNQLQPAFTEDDQPYFEVNEMLDKVIYRFYG